MRIELFPVSLINYARFLSHHAVHQAPVVATDEAQAVKLVVERDGVDFAVLGIDSGLDAVVGAISTKM